MFNEIPELGSEDTWVLDQIRVLWRQLLHQISNMPHRWQGSLRRSALARNLQGSNSIEGFVVNQDDALAAADGDEAFEAEGDTWAAVTNYRDAMTFVQQLSKSEAFRHDENLIRSLHFMITRDKLSGGPGLWREGAIFVRDSATGKNVYEGAPWQEVDGLIGRLTNQLNHPRKSVSPMIVAAMAHLNLVLIHPFKDGNGRMGRCLQTLVLAQRRVLAPQFCSIEEYLGKNTPQYYATLAEVGGGQWSHRCDVRPWIRFILTAHYRQAKTVERRRQEMTAICGELETLCHDEGIADRAVIALADAAHGHRIRNTDYRRSAEVTAPVAQRDLKRLVEADLLETEGEARGRYYRAAARLLEIRERHAEESQVEDPYTLAENIARIGGA